VPGPDEPIEDPGNYSWEFDASLVLSQVEDILRRAMNSGDFGTVHIPRPVAAEMLRSLAELHPFYDPGTPLRTT
jgi:hypothetical protein